MQIRKNTKAFKTIFEIISRCRDRSDREAFIRLYITKAGDAVKDRISVDAMDDQAGVFYEMSFDAVLTKLQSLNYQLHESEEFPGVFFFRSTSNKSWDETPFEFDEGIRQEFASLPTLPATRRREKVEKFVLARPKGKAEAKPAVKATTKKQALSKAPPGALKQHDYKLRQKVVFTDLDNVVFRQAGLTKRGVLDYYDQMAEYILPYLKDRPIVVNLGQNPGRKDAFRSVTALAEKGIELPEWIERLRKTTGEAAEDLLLCNDKEHLMFYAEAGAATFNVTHAGVHSMNAPDYFLICIESPKAALGKKVIDVALGINKILSGLSLPSFVKTDGISSLHVYVPLDCKSDFDTARSVAECVCNLVRLKLPDAVTFKGIENYHYGKVSIDYLVNDTSKSVIAPYSLAPGESATVATPIEWQEVNHGLRTEGFNFESMPNRVTQSGDPFDNFLRKKVNAADLLKRLSENYSFLF